MRAELNSAAYDAWVQKNVYCVGGAAADASCQGHDSSTPPTDLPPLCVPFEKIDGSFRATETCPECVPLIFTCLLDLLGTARASTWLEVEGLDQGLLSLHVVCKSRATHATPIKQS